MPFLWNVDPVSSCRRERAHPCFLGSGMEGLFSGAAGRGPCRDTGSALWSCWVWCTGCAEAALGCVRVSNPDVEVINKVSTGREENVLLRLVVIPISIMTVNMIIYVFKMSG